MTPDPTRPSNWTHATADDPPTILDASGKPVQHAIDSACPQCGAGPEKRQASGGFGIRRPVCTNCGHKFEDEVWHD